jgi:hypothetical protein
VGHGGTYNQDNGGDFAKFAIAWFGWWLKDDLSSSGKGMFVGPNCGLCNTYWDIQSKMLE